MGEGQYFLNKRELEETEKYFIYINSDLWLSMQIKNLKKTKNYIQST